MGVVPPHACCLVTVIARGHVEDAELSQILGNNVFAFHIMAQARVARNRAVKAAVKTGITCNVVCAWLSNGGVVGAWPRVISSTIQYLRQNVYRKC